MFFEKDYPEWVNTLYKQCGDNVKHDISTDVWESIKYSDTIPHIGNAICDIMFENIIDYMVRLYGESTRGYFNTYTNSMNTNIYFDNERYDDIDELKKAIEDKIKELVDE